MNNLKDFITLLEKYQQHHILDHFKSLSLNEKDDFFSKSRGLDFKLVYELYKKSVSSDSMEFSKYSDIAPPDIIRMPGKPFKDNLCALGETSIKNGENAVIIVSGGQATRLGKSFPKGMYPISPLKKKSLFRILSEKIRAISEKYGAKIPLLIMANPENSQTIKEYFTQNGFFGLEPSDVSIFCQDMLPSISTEGKFLLKNKTEFYRNPDGHGGTLKALLKSGLIDNIEENGIKRLFYCHVDNPLVNILDPFFLGAHIRNRSEMSLKSVKKLEGEKVGTVVRADGKTAVIEYTEFAGYMKKRGEDPGNASFGAGSIGIHILENDFIKKTGKKGYYLPYHRQVKEIKMADGTKKDILKFETFIFDALLLAENVSCVETDREQEFAPLKNSKGEDSPSDVKRKMVKLYKKWLAEAGIKVTPEAKVEISPLFAISKEELITKIEGEKINVSGDIYIE